MSTIKLRCTQCNNEFDCETKAYNRGIKRGKPPRFCSRSCAAKYGNANSSLSKSKKLSKANSRVLIGNKRAYKGKFTYYLNKSRNRNVGFDIDETYLSSIWTGKCALSKIEIHIKNGKHTLTTASLDRIDSTKGYVKGNVQFVAYGLNLGKNKFSDEEILFLIEAIRKA